MVLSQKKSIQKKLLAATSMLLVACIMLISASYAWFTLSTAPEIKGITTTIGANGNLEIALADDSTWANPNDLKTSVRDKGNTTWGNLIDVSEKYGLEDISLLPSRLFLASADGISASPLQAPKYGADGRPFDWVDAQNAYYSEGNDAHLISDTYHGVRSIGVSSSMTDRQLAYRSAKITLANAIAAAKAQAKASLENNGTDLANIVMKKAVDDAGTVTYGTAELTTIGNVLTGITTAQEQMLEAWEAAVISYAASATGEAIDSLNTEAKYLAFKGAMEIAGGYTVDTQAKTVTATIASGNITLDLPGEFTDYYTKIDAIAKKITSAKNELKTLQDAETAAAEKGKISWTDLTKVLNYIVNAQAVTVNDIGYTALKTNLNSLLSDVLGGSGIEVQMPTGSGLYADIADFCGNYNATVSLQGITYGDITLGTADKPIKATMTTKTTVTTPYFTAAEAVVTNGRAPSNQGANSNKLSDFYGYALDFYLRTNAANANLLLQVDEKQRIYGESTNEDTLGGGSNMTFTSQDINFTTDQMKKIMGAIRVVFSDGDSRQLLAVAALDTVNATKVNDTIVKANLKLCEYTTPSENNAFVLRLTDADATTAGLQPKFLTKQEITSLPQNQAVKLTATVYLDGDYVTNDMVANALSSMSGNLNLQFATDQKLVPMQDAALMGAKKEQNQGQ